MAPNKSFDLFGPLLPFVRGKVTLISHMTVTLFTEILDLAEVLCRFQSPVDRVDAVN